MLSRWERAIRGGVEAFFLLYEAHLAIDVVLKAFVILFVVFALIFVVLLVRNDDTAHGRDSLLVGCSAHRDAD